MWGSRKLAPNGVMGDHSREVPLSSFGRARRGRLSRQGARRDIVVSERLRRPAAAVAFCSRKSSRCRWGRVGVGSSSIAGRPRRAKKRTWGTLNGVWVSHDVRDQIVDFVRRWSEASEIGAGRFVGREQQQVLRCRASGRAMTSSGWRRCLIRTDLWRRRVGALKDWEVLRQLGKPPGDILGDILTRFGPGFMEREYPAFDSPSSMTGTVKPNTEDERFFITLEARFWLNLGKVGFTVLPANRSGFRIVIDYNFCVLGAIAFQLALTMSATESFFTCSGCGVPYMRTKKRPKPGESNFCESCDRSGVAMRNADRARRERMRQARQLRADGLTISEIAKKVGARNVSTVRRWIEKGMWNGKAKAR
jgi:hypothetical protein